MAWKEVRQSGDLIKWDEARSVEGFYSGSEERTTQYGVNTIHFIDAEGGRIAFFGTVLLTDALKAVNHGQLVRITYTGKKTKTPQGFMKEFTVEAWEADEPAGGGTA